MQQPVDTGWGKRSPCPFVAAGREACPGASGARAVTWWPEDVSDPALGSLRVEGSRVSPVPCLPPPLLSDIPP